MYPIVTGDFDVSQALPVDTNAPEYDPDASFVQSMIALRMLSWAGAARFQQAASKDSVVVHACHPGEVATPTLFELQSRCWSHDPGSSSTGCSYAGGGPKSRGFGPGSFLLEFTYPT